MEDLQSTASIFISYRRDDTNAFTGRLDDYLRLAFGNDAILRDVDSIPLGVDFVSHIRRQLAACQVMVVVIGKNWSSRLSDEHDFVRLEVETALSRDIAVIPVLTDGASLPGVDAVPISIRPLLTRNGISIGSGKEFKFQVESLIKDIKSFIASKANSSPLISNAPDYGDKSVLGRKLQPSTHILIFVIAILVGWLEAMYSDKYPWIAPWIALISTISAAFGFIVALIMLAIRWTKKAR